MIELKRPAISIAGRFFYASRNLGRFPRALLYLGF